MLRNKNKAFTLIELLIVIAIIGLLASIVLVALSGARSKARDAKRLGDLRNLNTAMQLYYSDNGFYPSTGWDWSSWGNWSSLLSSTYVSKMPVDPLNQDLGGCNTTANCHIYLYCPYNNNQNYYLMVNLENSANSYGNTNPPGGSGCTIGGPNNWWVGQ